MPIAMRFLRYPALSAGFRTGATLSDGRYADLGGAGPKPPRKPLPRHPAQAYRMAMEKTGCVVVGGGPAGMMAGLLFARAGLSVRVLEKHADFFRDFRGDTVHPSTMEILEQLGLLAKFLARPHDRLDTARIRVAGIDYTIGDLSHLDTAAPFIAMMPQWEFLDFLRDGTHFGLGARGEQHGGAFGHKTKSNSAADATASAGNDSNFACQKHRCNSRALTRLERGSRRIASRRFNPNGPAGVLGTKANGPTRPNGVI